MYCNECNCFASFEYPVIRGRGLPQASHRQIDPRPRHKPAQLYPKRLSLLHHVSICMLAGPWACLLPMPQCHGIFTQGPKLWPLFPRKPRVGPGPCHCPVHPRPKWGSSSRPVTTWPSWWRLMIVEVDYSAELYGVGHANMGGHGLSLGDGRGFYIVSGTATAIPRRLDTTDREYKTAPWPVGG